MTTLASERLEFLSGVEVLDLRQRLYEIGVVLPPAPKSAASYLPVVRAGGLVFVSGQLPLDAGRLIASGRVPSAVDLESAQAAARQCALNGLAVLDAEFGGDWSAFKRVVRVGVFVASDPAFTDQHLVANGASDFLSGVFGDRGRHSRAAVGASALPLGAAVEVELTVQIDVGRRG